MTTGENGMAVLFQPSVDYILIMSDEKMWCFLMKFVKTNKAIF